MTVSTVHRARELHRKLTDFDSRVQDDVAQRVIVKAQGQIDEALANLNRAFDVAQALGEFPKATLGRIKTELRKANAALLESAGETDPSDALEKVLTQIAKGHKEVTSATHAAWTGRMEDLIDPSYLEEVSVPDVLGIDLPEMKLRSSQARLRALRQSDPFKEVDFDPGKEIAELSLHLEKWQTAKDAIDQLLKDFPLEIQAFVATAGTVEGALVTDLTPVVLDWLTAQRNSDAYRVIIRD
jgi:hypothetical protein